MEWQTEADQLRLALIRAINLLEPDLILADGLDIGVLLETIDDIRRNEVPRQI